MEKKFIVILLFIACIFSLHAQKQLTKYVNPLLGTATLWDSIDIGYNTTHRTWGADIFSG